MKTTKEEFESLENDEARLKEEIRVAKRDWREEKTRLTYEASNVEKRQKKSVELENPIPKRATNPTKKTSILPHKQPVIQRTASVVMHDHMRSHVDSIKLEATEALAKEKSMKESARIRKEALLKDESSLAADIEELKRAIENLETPTMETPVSPPPVATLSPSSPISGEKSNKRYTQLLSTEKQSSYFFYETDITSLEMVNYLTKQLDRLFRNLTVSFEDLFKLQSLFETDEGRRVFCFTLFQKIRTQKRASSRTDLIILSSDSFDLVLWLINTVLQSMKAHDETPDFFAARVLMKYSFKIVREVPMSNSVTSGASSIRIKSPRKTKETVQKFIRSDPIWRTLSFWQELFYGDMNKKLARKFDKGANSSQDLTFSGREKKFLFKFLESFVKSLGNDWLLPRSLQENFVYSVAENVGLSQNDKEKALQWIVSEANESSTDSTSFAPETTLRGRKKSISSSSGPQMLGKSQTVKGQSTSQQKLIQTFTMKQKREVFGAPLRPYKNLLTMFNDVSSDGLDANEAERILPTPIWDVIQFLDSDERCLNCPGIFRQSGDKDTLLLLKAKIEANEEVRFDQLDPHEVAAILKLWVRELQEPLTTFDVYSIIVTANDLEGEAKFLFVKKVISKIPDANKIALKRLLLLLKKYATHTENKMSEKNLAVVFAPALFRERTMNINSMSDVQKYVIVTQYLLENVETLF